MDENNQIRYLSVSALNKYLFYKFDTDLNLKLVYLKAELSNVRFSKGIYYFVLKDKESEISAIMYGSYAERLNFTLNDGVTVLVSGRVAVYPKRGTYSVNVLTMEEAGIGESYLEFLRLKEKLTKEGLFDDKYKKPIKRFNHIIGVVTSETGDARHDVYKTVMKRYPLATIKLFPAIVQGADAPKSIINAILDAERDATCDCLIVCRGGGSVEDLSCFNDEELARVIFDCPIPIISGVGHEQDYTICDFVSDLRAPTPTGAGMFASPNMTDLIYEIDSVINRLNSKMNLILNDYNNKFNTLNNSYVLNNFDEYLDNKINNIDNIYKRISNLNPVNKIDKYISDVINYKNRMDHSTNTLINNIDNTLENNINKLILLNPLNIMSKGYTVTFQDGKAISNIDEVDKDKLLNTSILGGSVISEIKEIKKDKNN